MEKIVSKIVALGVPGLVLFVALSATGYAGAAAITTALAAIGPFGILGGIASLGILALFSQAITEYGFEAIYVQVIKELIKKGETKESILEYVHAVQDLNPVYYEEVPSVPELMILTHMAHHVLDEELLLQLDITFTAPFYGGDVISVEKYDIRAEGRLQKGSCELVGTHGGRATCKWIYGKELLNDKD